MATIHVCPLCRAQVMVEGPIGLPNETVYDGKHPTDSCLVNLRDRIERLEARRKPLFY
jgi:hypothetical protein